MEETEKNILTRLTELSEEIAKGSYQHSEELFELTKDDTYSHNIAHLAEAFGMMMIQVEAREFRLEQIISQLRDINERLRFQLNKTASHYQELQKKHIQLEDLVENRTENLLQAITKSKDLILRMKDLEFSLRNNTGLSVIPLETAIAQSAEKFPSLTISTKGKAEVLADQALDSVLDNLMHNALHHGDASHIECHITNDASHTVLSFADNGCGIPDAIKDKVFDERFSSGKQAQSGLGLFIVKQTMERYGGSVDVIDNLPRGAKFRLFFKRVR